MIRINNLLHESGEVELEEYVRMTFRNGVTVW